MKRDSERKEQVISQIRLAFADVTRPEADNIVIGHDPESVEVRIAFEGKDWHDIGVGVLVPQRMDSLCFMTPEAYHYYLPAYMITGIEVYYDSDLALDSAVDSLTKPEPQDGSYYRKESLDTFRRRIGLLSNEQKKAVRVFLEYLDSEHGDDYPIWGPRTALERYWRSV